MNMKTTFAIIGLIFTALASQGQVLLTDAVIQGASFSGVATGGSGTPDANTPDIVWLKFDGSTTNVTDYSSRGTNTFALDSTGTRTNSGSLYGITANGTSAYCQSVNSVSYPSTNVVTVMFWYRRVSGQATAILAENGAGATTVDGGWGVFIDDLGAPSFEGVLATDQYFVKSTPFSADGTWHHWSATYSWVLGGRIDIYKDGILQTDASTSGNNPSAGVVTSQTVSLLRRSTGQLYMGAGDQLADFRIYSGSACTNNLSTVIAAALHP